MINKILMFLGLKKNNQLQSCVIDYNPPVPNCAICKWKVKIEYKTDGQDCHYNECSAQGDRIVCDVYDNDNCKELFRSTEPEIHFTSLGNLNQE